MEYGIRNTGSMLFDSDSDSDLEWVSSGDRETRRPRGGWQRDFGPVMAQVAYKWSLMSSCQIELSAG